MQYSVYIDQFTFDFTPIPTISTYPRFNTKCRMHATNNRMKTMRKIYSLYEFCYYFQLCSGFRTTTFNTKRINLQIVTQNNKISSLRSVRSFVLTFLVKRICMSKCRLRFTVNERILRSFWWWWCCCFFCGRFSIHTSF